jgi:hypothetical protein
MLLPRLALDGPLARGITLFRFNGAVLTDARRTDLFTDTLCSNCGTPTTSQLVHHDPICAATKISATHSDSFSPRPKADQPWVRVGSVVRGRSYTLLSRSLFRPGERYYKGRASALFTFYRQRATVA